MGTTHPPHRVARNTAVLVALAAAGLLPIAFPDVFQPAPPSGGIAGLLRNGASLLIPAAALVFCWTQLTRLESSPGTRVLFSLLVLLAGLETYVHVIWVDRGNFLGEGPGNVVWQWEMHNAALLLDPGGIPHSYRFLPNSLTRIVEMLCGSYTFAREVYRFTFTLLLLFAIYRFARLYVGPLAAVMTWLLCGLVYPVTIHLYAGQLSDPMSNLSFVASYIALELGLFPYFLLALALGSLAKESVVVMLGYYLLFYRQSEPRFWLKFTLASALCLSVVAGTRLLVLHRQMGYADISGLSPQHILDNIFEYYRMWIPQVAFSLGIFVPFLVMGWRRAHPNLKRLTVFATAVLWITSWMFGYLHEVRLFVPAIVPMAVIAAGAIEDALSGSRPPERARR